jgi:hypothetical protein
MDRRLASMGSRFGRFQEAGAPISLGFHLMTGPTARIVVLVGIGAPCNVRMDMIELGPETVAAVDASDTVEGWRIT